MNARAWLIAGAALVLASCGKSAEAPADATADAAADTAADSETTVDAAALRPCPVLRNDLATTQDCERAGAARATIEEGLAAIRAPDRMEIDKPSVIRLAIGEKPDVAAPAEPSAAPEPEPEPSSGDAVAEPASTGPQGEAGEPSPPPPPPPPPPTATDVAEQVPGETVNYNPLIGQFMRAQLRHDGSFKVISAPEELQEVVEGGVTTWDWTVVPTRGGDHVLTIVTEAGFRDGAGKFRALQGVRPQTQTIHVYVPWWRRILDAVNGAPPLVKALTLLVTGITGLLTAVLGLRAVLRKWKSGGGDDPPGGAA